MTQPIKKNKSTAGIYKKLAGYIVVCMNWGLTPLGEMRKTTLMSVVAEHMIPKITIQVHGSKNLKFWCFGGWSAYRARSTLKKEPLTIEWIESIEPGSVFWDIGANVGTFSIFAAVAKNLKTYAFEPSLANIAVFSKNIELNKVDHLVTALPVALSGKSNLNYLNMRSTDAGNTGGQFSVIPHDAPVIFKQACLGWTMDDFIQAYNVPVPNYIKMDVDGLELEILKAAPKTLANPTLKSIITEFEVDTNDFREMEKLMQENGFKITKAEPTVPGRETVKNFVFAR